MFSSEQWAFQHGNAPANNANNQYMGEQQQHRCFGMAYFFARLEYYRKFMGLDDDTRIQRRKTVNTKEDLILAIRTTREVIPMNLLEKLFNSLSRHILVVIKMLC